jgi:hypothetical protein
LSNGGVCSASRLSNGGARWLLACP